MENEKKGNKVLEIILILLVALSFVLIPLLNQYRQKTISFNNTQLVKRSANGDGSSLIDKNGKISITYYDRDIITIYSSWNSFEIPHDENYYNTLINGGSISGINDVFGYSNFNYFRFKYNKEYSNKMVTNFENVYTLEYYIQLTNTTFYTFTLGYYQIVLDDFIYFTPISDLDFEQFNIIPTYNVLTFAYCNNERFNQTREFLRLTLGANNLLYIWENFQLDSRFMDKYTSDVTNVIFDKDFITPVANSTSAESYTRGYNDGYTVGFNEGTSNEGVFSMLKHAANSLQDLMNIEVLPHISLWLLISIPLSISIMLIMFKLLRGGN